MKHISTLDLYFKASKYSLKLMLSYATVFFGIIFNYMHLRMNVMIDFISTGSVELRGMKSKKTSQSDQEVCVSRVLYCVNWHKKYTLFKLQNNTDV